MPKQALPLEPLSLWARCSGCFNSLHLGNLMEPLELLEDEAVPLHDAAAILRRHKYRKDEENRLRRFMYGHKPCGGKTSIELTRGHVIGN